MRATAATALATLLVPSALPHVRPPDPSGASSLILPETLLNPALLAVCMVSAPGSSFGHIPRPIGGMALPHRHSTFLIIFFYPFFHPLRLPDFAVAEIPQLRAAPIRMPRRVFFVASVACTLVAA